MDNVANFLQSTFLFSGIDIQRIEELCESINYEIAHFQRADVIYSPSDFQEKIGFVLNGKCEVKHEKQNGSSTAINQLLPSSPFGVLAVFGKNTEFPTEIRANISTDVLFIAKESVFELINAEPRIAMNVIMFLVGRISFLNKRIATFSGTRVEDRLASFLLGERARIGADTIQFNCKKASEAINAGRASVYRALESLSASGYIKYENKKINIIDPMGLERIKK